MNLAFRRISAAMDSFGTFAVRLRGIERDVEIGDEACFGVD
jgi:hypothetical protein